MKKFLTNPKFIFIFFIFFITGLTFIYYNFYKFYSIYFSKKYELTRNFIDKKNNKILDNIKIGKYYLDDIEYNIKNFDLKKNNIFFRKEYVHRPVGYIDIYKNKIIFVSYSGEIFVSNEIEDIKKNGINLEKIKKINYDFEFDEEDGLFYRNIKIRDILVDNDNLLIVLNGRTKINDEEYYASPKIIKGKINIKESKINFQDFYDSKEKIYNVKDWSHTGGRLIKYKEKSYLLSVPDHALMDNYDEFTRKINSNTSVIGKILLINNDKSEVFSYGHRNPQGLYYDSINDLIFETEHGPTGGDEINLIKQNKNYGWPEATYGAFIEGLNKYRNHKKNGFEEPKKYWWPSNCAMSEIITVEKGFHKNWNKNITVLNACLSGTRNQGESIYRWEFNKENGKLIKKAKYYFGDRIRDIKYDHKSKSLILLLENQQLISIIYL